MSALPEIVEEYYGYGVRFMVVLLEDDLANMPTSQYLQQYAAKYSLPLDKVMMGADGVKNSKVYYDQNGITSVSLSVNTDRKGNITYTDEINAASPFKWQLDYELKRMCDELAAGTDAWPDNIHQLCTVKYKKDMPDSPHLVAEEGEGD